MNRHSGSAGKDVERADDELLRAGVEHDQMLLPGPRICVNAS
jgi:hypothetical protein